MSTNLLLTLLLVQLSRIVSYGQITLTAAVCHPSAGDIIQTHYTNADPGPGGSNITWDLTSATLNTIVREFPYNNICGTNNQTTIISSNSLMFPNCVKYSIGSDGLFGTASYLQGSHSMTYSDPIAVLFFPLTYDGQIYVDSFRSVYQSSPTHKITSGMVTITTDGFGTLMLPDSTYHDVLRVKTIEIGIDSMMESQMGQLIFQNAYVYQKIYYSWYSLYNKFPVLTAGETSYYFPASIENTLSIESENNVYPNPATTELTIKTNTIYKSYTITNSVGQTLISNNITGPETKIDINRLATGIYYITIDDGVETTTKKFVKM